mgnify:CR=1 FL=1|tara:strand:- start:234 stop:449 length:216 start_codon:yes stop_codon:yes gene_type:complete
MKLSDQALGAIMLALQNSLMNQTDIVPVLKDFDLMMDDKEEVIILNPPTIDFSDTEIQNQMNEKKNTVGSD